MPNGIRVFIPSEAEKAIELPPLSELTPLEDPTAYEGPTTAQIGGPSIPPPAKAPEAKLPATVVSRDKSGDTEITVNDNSRVLALSLSGTLAEMVYALGLSDNFVGRDVSTNVPGTEDLPIITRDGHSIDAEAVLALNPSVIITDGSIGPVDVVLQLRDAGIPVVTVDRAVDPESSYRTVQQVADALGVSDAAPAVISDLQEAIAAKEAEVQGLLPADPARLPRVAFLYVRGTAGIYYLFGEGSGADSLISSLGAVDVAGEVGWRGEKPMTEEALIAMDPDVILVMTKGLKSAGGVDGLIAAQPSIALTKAGEHRRIIDVDDTLIFAGGTRIPDVIDGLARAIYAPDSLKSEK
ncbi:heme/hemin ABC transporter substrate-binding protein [Leucobacter insecticola]|uniref:heme/hemin ABC transporter substrate-binding protein n=1 Tax=Leucobacter insecticola TaxID=2714934 RepID=UPI00197D121E|nr:ABC transporter substrate-binding protein [Leucobacter insecticola]